MAIRRSPARIAAFSLAALILGLGGVECASQALEHAGLGGVTLDDRSNYLLGPIFVPDEADGLRTSEYAERWMLPARLSAPTDGRVFVVGGSFAMGTPYEYQGYGREIGGGMVSWARAALTDEVELVNASSGGQSSYRVRRIVERLLEHDPAAFVVASCNNEGVSPPTRVWELLHHTATFRVLRDLFVDEAGAEERPQFMRRERTPGEIEDDFRANLIDIAEQTRDAGVPALFVAPPANLRMQSFQRQSASVGDPDGLLVEGEKALAQGRLADARAAFEEAMERSVDNRCPSSLRGVIEEVAAAHPHIRFVDLADAANAASKQGVPGDELFVDSCHMNWRGYSHVGAALADALHEAGIASRVPGTATPTAPTLRRVETVDEVFVANRRWNGTSEPPDGALNEGFVVGAPGTTLEQLANEAQLVRRGWVGSWALVPLLLRDEHWLPAPTPQARFELQERSPNVLAVTGYVSQPQARRLMNEPEGFIDLVLQSAPISPADQPVSIPADRIAGVIIHAPLHPEGPVRLRLR